MQSASRDPGEFADQRRFEARGPGAPAARAHSDDLPTLLVSLLIR